MIKLRFIYLVVLTATLSILNRGCVCWAHKSPVPEKVVVIMAIIPEAKPIQDTVHLYNPDIIAQLYKKSEDLFSVIWERRENIHQMPHSIRNVDLDGLNSKDFHIHIDGNTEGKNCDQTFQE